jgi:hypothetical protein
MAPDSSKKSAMKTKTALQDYIIAAPAFGSSVYSMPGRHKPKNGCL